MTLRLRLFAALLLLLAMAARSAATDNPPLASALWPADGPAAARLPDFSFAGYQQGEQPLPEVPQAANVRDFGAVGDGRTDDTRAIQAAIDATPRGAVYLPPGRYLISDYLRLTRRGLVLRGAGPERSVLWFPRGLDAVHPREGRTSTGDPASGYSFDGAFVTLAGNYGDQPLARITAEARRGDRSIEVDQPAAFAVGQLVLVTLSETPDQSLKTWLYNDDPGDIALGKPFGTRMLVRLTAIAGHRLQLDRPLRFATRAAWQPTVRSFAPTVTESGIEHLGFAFPAVKYRGHFKEDGHNAIELRQVFNCWVRDVAVHNGDLAFNVVACGNTLTHVVVTADTAREAAAAAVPDCTGHHAIQLKHAEDNLVTDFDVRTCYVHDLTVENAAGNVFSAGRGRDLNFDHHKDTPYGNLFTAIDAGRGTRLWHCGGGPSLGRQSAGWETFWGIRAARPLTAPPAGWGAPTMIFVGLTTEEATRTGTDAPWFEAVPPERLSPANLYLAQLARRAPTERAPR